MSGTLLECVVTKRRDRASALKILRKILSRYGAANEIVTDKLGSYRAVLRQIGYSGNHETGQYKNNQCENSHFVMALNLSVLAVLRAGCVFIFAKCETVEVFSD